MDPDRPVADAGSSGPEPSAPADAPSSSGRKPCLRCGKSCGGYCADCVLVLDPAAPQGLRLPVRLHIIQHGETNARSTALHAALLAPADVELHRHAGSTTSRRCDPLSLQLPEWDPASTAVLFPEGPDTPAVGDPACPPFQQLVVLESNWRKARGLLRHPRLEGLRRVQLPREVCSTEFEWRRGDGSFRGAVDEGLSSIEAIVHACRLLGPPGESYDSLLYFFRQQQAFVKKRGALPTSRQEARARQKKPRGGGGQQEQGPAAGHEQQAAADKEQQAAAGAQQQAADAEQREPPAGDEQREQPAGDERQAAGDEQQAAADAQQREEAAGDGQQAAAAALPPAG